jgi:hypothetical protein
MKKLLYIIIILALLLLSACGISHGKPSVTVTSELTTTTTEQKITISPVIAGENLNISFSLGEEESYQKVKKALAVSGVGFKEDTNVIVVNNQWYFYTKEEKIVGILIFDELYTTDKGLHIGMTVSEMLRLYGNPPKIAVHQTPGEQYPDLYYIYDEVFFNAFQIDENENQKILNILYSTAENFADYVEENMIYEIGSKKYEEILS